MVPIIARKRAAKAVRRKKLLAGRHAAAPASLAERVRSLAQAPLHCCLVQQEAGINSVYLARRTNTGEIAAAVFLVDILALGVKDVFFSAMQPSDFQEFLSIAQQA